MRASNTVLHSPCGRQGAWQTVHESLSSPPCTVTVVLTCRALDPFGSHLAHEIPHEVVLRYRKALHTNGHDTHKAPLVPRCPITSLAQPTRVHLLKCGLVHLTGSVGLNVAHEAQKLIGSPTWHAWQSVQIVTTLPTEHILMHLQTKGDPSPARFHSALTSLPSPFPAFERGLVHYETALARKPVNSTLNIQIDIPVLRLFFETNVQLSGGQKTSSAVQTNSRKRIMEQWTPPQESCLLHTHHFGWGKLKHSRILVAARIRENQVVITLDCRKLVAKHLYFLGDNIHRVLGGPCHRGHHGALVLDQNIAADEERTTLQAEAPHDGFVYT